MTDWMEAMGLHHFGFSDDQIARIDAAIPKAQYVWNILNENKTVSKELFEVGGMILNQLAQFKKENPQ